MGDMGGATGIDDPGGSEKDRGAEVVKRIAGSGVCREPDGKLRRRICVSGGISRYEGFQLTDENSMQMSASRISGQGQNKEHFVVLQGVVGLVTVNAGVGRNGSFGTRRRFSKEGRRTGMSWDSLGRAELVAALLEQNDFAQFRS